LRAVAATLMTTSSCQGFGSGQGLINEIGPIAVRDHPNPSARAASAPSRDVVVRCRNVINYFAADDGVVGTSW
jgi:hypothetical protein